MPISIKKYAYIRILTTGDIAEERFFNPQLKLVYGRFCHEF